MNKDEFKRFLQKNQPVKSIIIEHMKPRLWTIDNELPACLLEKKEAKQELRRSLRIPGTSKPQNPGSFGEKAAAQQETCQSSDNEFFLEEVPDLSFEPFFKGDVLQMHGELTKVGRKHKRQTRRYYVLKQNTLVMFLSKKHRNPRRVYFLRGAYVEPKDSLGLRVFHEHKEFSSIELFADSEALRDQWLRKLQRAAGYFSFEKKYERLNQIGRGKFSNVFKCRSRKSDQVFALKEITKANLDKREMTFIREEIQIFTVVAHPNAARMLEVFETERHILIVMDLVDGGELFEFIVSQKEVPPEQVTKMLFHILEVVQYLKIASIVHRDLKPENILVTREEKMVKIIDFGLSKILNPGTKMFDQCGTPAYAAPEVFQNKGYSTPVDVWSAGIIAHAMLTQKLPWPEYHNDQQELHRNVKEGNLDLSFFQPFQATQPLLHDLISKMLQPDPEKRITVEDALSHKVFSADNCAPT